MANLDIVVAESLVALEQSLPLDDAEEKVPDRPGLYAIYGGAAVWADLELGRCTGFSGRS